MTDDKYIVFKREDFDEFFRLVQADRPYIEALTDRSLNDAVVIRTQDVFAGPALHCYAASISVAAKLVSAQHIDRDYTEEEASQINRLQQIADYFHERALEADESEQKVPD